MNFFLKISFLILLLCSFALAQEEDKASPSLEEKNIEKEEDKAADENKPEEKQEEKATEEKPSEENKATEEKATEENKATEQQEEKVVLKNYGLPDELWDKCSYTCDEEEILDMTTDYWCALNAVDQAKYARMYQEGYAKNKNLEIEKIATVSEANFEMRLVPPGRFWIGSEDKEKGRNPYNEYSCRIVLSKPYYMCKYEITQGQWKAVMGNNPSFFQKSKNHPVEQVAWEEHCKGFCEKTEMSLPTEAQWEYACRSGVYGMSYIGDFDISGDNNAPALGSIAWYSGNSSGKTNPVGKKEPNAWGFHDMLGNVWEWCEDACYYVAGNVMTKTYKDDIADPKSVDSSMERRIYRGGSWDSIPRACRAATRNGNAPAFKNNKLGFRCIKEHSAFVKKSEEKKTEE